MSLLNDALRAAEQRQERPDIPAAYPGQGNAGVASGSRRRGTIIAVTVLLVALGLGGYGWLVLGSESDSVASRSSGTVAGVEPAAGAPAVLSGEAKADRGDTDRAVIGRQDEQGGASAAPAVAQINDLNPAEPVEKATAPVVASTVAAHGEAPVARTGPKPGPEPAPKPEPVSDKSAAVEPQPVPSATRGQASVIENGNARGEEPATPSVKQARETPEAVDRRTSREIERLIATGQWNEAGQVLTALTGRQTAPRSRGTMAKALLVDGEPGRALAWLPAEVADGYPSLRLLRGRALLEQGNLEAAVATLEARVPAVDGNAEYRVTLATLLQQQGRSQEAARHWAELIAWDDGHGPWWVGLGIALESQGERASATRAYQQAAALPGLPRSLADYVRQRLQSLGAG